MTLIQKGFTPAIREDSPSLPLKIQNPNYSREPSQNLLSGSANLLARSDSDTHVDTTTTEPLDVAVVIPTMNEAESISDIIQGCYAALKDLRYQIIVVDAHSSDGTDNIAQTLGATVLYQRRRGYGDALRTGFFYVMKEGRAKIIVMMDADSSYDPKDIPSLLQPILSDMVVGNRFSNMIPGAMTRKNRIGNKLISWVARRTLYVDIQDTQCGLRAFRTGLLQNMSLSDEGMAFATEMIVDAVAAKADVTEVPVSYRPRIGRSKLNPFRDGFHIVGTIIRLVRDTQPLWFFGGIATVWGVLGLLLGVEVTLEWLKTGTVRRIPSAVFATLLLVGAIQFFTIGLVADMIKRLKRSNHAFR